MEGLRVGLQHDLTKLLEPLDALLLEVAVENPPLVPHRIDLVV